MTKMWNVMGLQLKTNIKEYKIFLIGII